MANKPEDTLITELAQALGTPPDAVAKIAQIVTRHIEAGDLIVTRSEDTIARAKAGLAALGRLFDGQLALPEASQALGDTLGGVCSMAGAKEIAAEKVPARPRQKGLPEALYKMADAAEVEPGKLAVAGTVPAMHRARAGRIGVLRSLVGELLVSADLLLDNLAVDERQAADDLLAEYKLVRTAAQSNRRLGELLAAVEDYLFGAQKQGAETRAFGRAREAALTDKATRRARAAADTTARKEIADDLGAILTSFAERPTDDKPQGR